jgi:quercetin dioxygenase-like cupin family protein
MSNETTTGDFAVIRPVRRVVTGHNAEAKAVVQTDDSVPPIPITDDAAITSVWASPTFPIDNNDATDRRDQLDARIRGEIDADDLINRGSVCRTVDMLPGHVSPMHRTDSLDYGIVTHGTPTLILDDGSKTVLAVGDVVVQRGTNHCWANESDEPCRLVFILIEATSAVVDGVTLTPHF